jgi:lipopolysaccharide export system permease protein
MKKKKYNGHWFDLWKQCIGTRWDMIVDLRNSVVSRLLFAGKRALHKRGSGRHKVIDNAAVLGVTPPPDPHIWLTPQAEAEAARLVPEGRIIVALGPAANWPPKQWPVESFVALVKALTGAGGALADATVLVIADRHEYAQVAPLLDSIPEARRIALIGRDLQIAAACLKRARLYIGNDSGLMHLAAALGVPTLGLFGPGYPDIYRPWGEKGAFITTPESRATLLARLPDISAREPNLMRSLSVERVVEAAKLLLARTEKP